MKKYLIALVISGFSIACSKQADTKVNSDLKQAEKPQQLSEREAPVENKLTDNKTIKRLSDTLPTKEKKVVLNGEFFKVENPLGLIKGSQVFNMAMAQYGVIKGSVVIVTKLDVSALTPDSKSEVIASDTYRIIPKDKSQLLALYKRLNSNDDIEIVELEIDYSGRNAPITQ